ncbi:MAG: hypothetical protein GXO29_03155 [Thermotogae bacterium]|nr:hypothetical protein [Thermotogota bacterium]
MKGKAVAFAGQPLSGKTYTLAHILAHLKKIPKADTKYLDYEPDEQERGSTTTLKVFSVIEPDARVHFLDTPGFIEFFYQSDLGIRMADTAFIFLKAGSEVDASVEHAYLTAKRFSIPSTFVITQYSSGEWQKTLDSIRELTGGKAQIFSEPGTPPTLENMSDDLKEEVISFDDELLEKFLEEGEVGDDEIRAVLERALRSPDIHPVLFIDGGDDAAQLYEYIKRFVPGFSHEEVPAVVIFKASFDPSMGEQFYGRAFGKITKGMELRNRRTGTVEKLSHIYVPLGKNREEVDEILAGDFVVLPKLKDAEVGDVLTAGDVEFSYDFLEEPFKPYVVAISPRGRSSEEKISDAMHRLSREDRSFSYEYNAELHQHLLKAQGATHVNAIVSRLKGKFGVEVDLTRPKIPYRETIRKKAEAEGKIKKQTGGRGQYAIANIRIEPLPREKDYEFINSIFGGAIPKEYIPSVETGIKKAMAEGVVAGYPVVNVKIELYDGKHHPVDSSNFAFEMAGKLAFKNAAEKADPYILEPFYEVEILVPEEHLGDVMGEINSRRGRVMGFEPAERKGYQRIKALVPLENVYDLIVPLRSITKGRTELIYRFSHYEEAPKNVQDRVIAEYQQAQSQG